ncbi:molybdate ABC transporter permease subunit [Maridesulfovibrio salexigens]|uniref:Binding-protein-dependent transport systems inner membrane component n=1 Tax=Maridesulfovibrio salexigens (strain ATCC 14822 / DSM 2638 / NCIMB 8403 / VKM B-1763) TaxID=526222 RepID=C6BWC5_MARSD|nr:ABC transporter permease subunit [Maridesulfovibrio salexigens]ACS78369.1 binding-protein-dependent transport systems inner membrane component [Maridesulfovibrio salexigens DSM 2638]
MDIGAILSDSATLSPLALSAKVMGVAGVLQLIAGVPLAFWLSRSKGVLHNFIDTAVTLPLVFPPVATGFVLLFLLGRRGPAAELFGDSIIFGFPGLVVAAFIAGLPLLVKPVQAALKSAEAAKLHEVAAVLGKSETEIFLKVLLPCTKRAIAAGTLLALARSLGEVGMSLMLGGNVIGRTNTLSLEIYNAVFNGEFERAAVLSSIIGIASITIFSALKKFSDAE